jgi:hypothetical protein
MKRIFTFAIALLSMFSAWQMASAANVTFTVTVPSPTYQCWIVGSFNGWNNNDKQLTKVDDTHYTITMDDATWAAGVTTANVQYKYCSGGNDWAFVEKHADGSEIRANRVYTGTNVYVDPLGVNPSETAIGTNGVDVVAKWATVYNPNVPPMPLNVTIDVLVPAGTFQCYIVGTFNNWAGPTAPVDSVKMVKVATNDDGTMIFEKRIFTADANKLAYHFCCGPDWSFEQSAPTGDYKYPEIAPVVTAWKKIFDPTTLGNVTVVATVPAGTGDKVWIQGGWLGWNFSGGAGGQLMTKNTNGTFSFTVSNIVSTEYRLYNRQDWGFPEVDATGAERTNRSVTATAGQTITEAISVIAWKQPFDTKVQELGIDSHRIYSANHSLVVEGVTSQVDVIDMTGRILQSAKTVGTFTSKNLNSGLYIIRVDGAATKVALK